MWRPDDWIRLVSQKLPAEEYEKSGDRLRWRCWFHQDGESLSEWSCYGFPNGRLWCFGCKTGYSGIDLYVLLKTGDTCSSRSGRMVQKDEHGKILWEHPLYRTYCEGFREYGYLFDDLKQGAFQRSAGREFDELEQKYLGDVWKFSHEELLGDRQALGYLRSRGVNSPLPIFGTLRTKHLDELLSMAKNLGDETLPVRVGLQSKKPEYQHLLTVRNMILTFQESHYGARYYQGRAYLDRGKFKFFNPANVARIPFVHGLNDDRDAPAIGAEGIFKVAWLLERGWRIVAYHGAAPEEIGEKYLKPIHRGLYAGDNDLDKIGGIIPGLYAADIIQSRADLCGYAVRQVFPPRRYKNEPIKDIDEWAARCGYDNVERRLRAQVLDHRRSLSK